MLGIALAALPTACASEPETPPPAPEMSPTRRRQRMLFDTESVVHRALQDARRDTAAIVAEFMRAVDAAPRVFRLNTSVPELSVYGEAEQKRRREVIDQAREIAETKASQLLEQYDAALWAAAERAGRDEGGQDLGSRSGYFELDDKVEAARVQLERTVDLEALRDQATLKIYDDVGMEREVRIEIPQRGVLSLFKSSPTLGLFTAGQEGQAIVVAFLRDGIAADVALSLVQAQHQRIEHGNMVLTSTPWTLEMWNADTPGVVPLRPSIDVRHAIASEPLIPTIDTSAPEFAGSRDRVVVHEFLTAVRRDDTGELLATIGWQVRWNVDFRGFMRVLTDVRDVMLPDDAILPALLAAATPRQ